MSIKDERGVALVLALAAIALLVSLVVDFSYTMMVDLTLAANLRDEHKAFYVARSGMEMARHILQEDDNDYDGLDEEWAQFSEHVGYISEDDEGRFKGTIEDEAGKFPINTLITLIDEKWVIDEDKRRQLEWLFEALELDPALIVAIVDWLDGDHTVGAGGAEDAYYEELSPPYPCKDGPLSSLEELLLVKGMTEEILYGTEEKKGLIHYLTIYSSEEGRININTASAEVLQSLSKDITEGVAQIIISEREDEPFTNTAAFLNVLATEGIEDIDIDVDDITVESSAFSIHVEGEVRGIKKGIFAVLATGAGVSPVFWRVE